MSSNVFRTPMSNRTTGFSDQASSSASAQKRYDDVQNDLEGNAEEVGGGGGARVYWYAPPSPSLQVQQAEHQRIMARAGAIQPMASQAFRDELLGPPKVQEIENNTRSRKIGRRTARRSNATSTSANSGSAESTNKGKNARDSTGGIDQILDDLDEHLMNKKVELLSEEQGDEYIAKDGATARNQCTSQVDTDNLQQVLIEGMDRAFSQDKDNYIIASTLPLISRNAKNWSRTASMPVQRSSQSDTHSIKNPIIALPIQEDGGLLGKRTFPHSPEGASQIDSREKNTSIDAMDISPCKPSNRNSRSSPNKRRAAAESINPVPLQERDSNTEPPIAVIPTPQVKIRKGQFSRSVSEGVGRMNAIERLEVGTMTSDNDAKVVEEGENESEEPIITEGKSRSGANLPQTSKVTPCPEKRSPNINRQRTVPRCGLSRSAAPSSSRQHQMISGKDSIFSNPASSSNVGRKSSVNAPFKQPMRRSPRKNDGENQKRQTNVGSRSISRSTSDASDVITINDSSDDEAEEKHSKGTGKEKTKPIKASPSAKEEEVVVETGKFTLDRSNEAVTTTATGDISFDTSLDDEALCDALDKIEASQSVQEEQPTDKISQSIPAHPTSDDSFDNMIDDDVSAAILSRMDEEGW